MVKTVTLDIGHGNNTFPPSKGIYKDGKAYPEHSFNAKLVQAIDPLLRANGINTIIYQKPNKTDIPLLQRTNYYNAQKVDLVYSIHANYNNSASVNGRCAFYWITSAKSKQMAETVVDEIKKAGYSTHGDGLHASERGSWTNLHICRKTKMPAVLVENGFMSGNKDFDLVFGSKQASYIKDMAQVHAKAICRYLGIVYNSEKDSGSTETHTPPKQQNKPATVNKPSKPASGSVVDYMTANGMDASYSNRAKLAKQYGISGYKGTASQNATLLSKIKAGKPKQKSPAKKGDMKTNSIVTYLNSIGTNSSYVNRAKLAKQYGISNYKGTAAQNTSLLSKMRSGASVATTKPKGDQKTSSVVDYLKSISVNSSYANRKKLAAKHGIKNYSGTAAQNAQLLKKLR